MSIRDDLIAALPGVTSSVVNEFGVLCAARRGHETGDQPDNSEALEYLALPDQSAPFPVVLVNMSDRQRREAFGLESKARVLGLAALSRGLRTGDLLRPATGAFCRRVFEVANADAIDEGGLMQVGLVERTSVPEGAF